jgi:DNA-binding NtrC family response regulator
LILGETGTGKSALAERVIHPNTKRTGPFVAVDLGALPQTLIASELFGSARGAYSGATDRRGLFEEAHGGTLFLDEIGNLPPEAQRMLLLALQDARITRLGETKPRTVDVKLVAATNAELRAKVQNGEFRADLYARLNPAARLVMPPLRTRLEDLEELARVFARRKFALGADRSLLIEYMEVAEIDGSPSADLQIARQRGNDASPSSRGVRFVLARSSLDELMAHPWRGNVRELELLVASAIVFALSDALEASREGRGARGDAARTIPIPAKLVRELLGAFGSDEDITPNEPTQHNRMTLRVRAGASLHEVARSLEVQVYEKLFAETKGDFEAMAQKLLRGSDPAAVRRVRLRFNQLGLRVRSPASKSRKS